MMRENFKVVKADFEVLACVMMPLDQAALAYMNVQRRAAQCRAKGKKMIEAKAHDHAVRLARAALANSANHAVRSAAGRVIAESTAHFNRPDWA